MNKNSFLLILAGILSFCAAVFKQSSQSFLNGAVP